MKTKNSYEIKIEGLVIQAFTSDEAIKIVKNKFTPIQIRYSCISSVKELTEKDIKDVEDLCDYDTDGDGTPIGYRD